MHRDDVLTFLIVGSIIYYSGPYFWPFGPLIWISFFALYLLCFLQRYVQCIKQFNIILIYKTKKARSYQTIRFQSLFKFALFEKSVSLGQVGSKWTSWSFLLLFVIFIGFNWHYFNIWLVTLKIDVLAFSWIALRLAVACACS